jgi:hypothetical protein
MGINQLSPSEKREIYSRLIPPVLLRYFHIDPSLKDPEGNDLMTLKASSGSPVVELALRHEMGFPDPVLYGQMTDTVNGQIHVLLYILNDPDSPRFNVDRLPNGESTRFGTTSRNIEAEVAALRAGLAPGQVRHGLRMLSPAIERFEHFVQSLGHDLYFVEPLYYHNAVVFERYGFGYLKGRRLMERFNRGFAPEGDLLPLLDGSTPFRQPEAARSIRLRSWAIHDNILGEPFDKVTMYKEVGKSMNLDSCEGCEW